ncbi:unnamed protein product, partial [Nippostrongylus brasiliensis]|uniref:Uncharacterized protein n=1 Tax=Nippostrongylus brasiliensis TaxID=27835 RepID=A0A0N4XLU7_NIPBR
MKSLSIPCKEFLQGAGSRESDRDGRELPDGRTDGRSSPSDAEATIPRAIRSADATQQPDSAELASLFLTPPPPP